MQRYDKMLFCPRSVPAKQPVEIQSYGFRCGLPVFCLNLLLETFLITSDIEYGEEDMDYNKWNQEVKPMLEEYMERELERVFILCRGMNSDAYEIGKYAAMKFHSAEEWEQYDWKSRYPELNMEFDVSLYVENEEINSLGG